VKCYICDKTIRKPQAYFGDEETPLEGKPVCEDCYCEDEPFVTVLHGRDDIRYIISETRNETDGDFRVRWHSTDPWRGYYEVKAKNTPWRIHPSF